jgi:hypothetical protein
MERKDSSFKAVLTNILGGLVIGAVVGAAVAIRERVGSREATRSARAATVDGAQLAVAADHETDTFAADPLAAAPPGQPEAVPQLHPGWELVEREPLPAPTYWPAALAFGIVLLCWGIVTSWIVGLVGGIVLAVALVGWIGDLRHGH